MRLFWFLLENQRKKTSPKHFSAYIYMSNEEWMIPASQINILTSNFNQILWQFWKVLVFAILKFLKEFHVRWHLYGIIDETTASALAICLFINFPAFTVFCPAIYNLIVLNSRNFSSFFISPTIIHTFPFHWAVIDREMCVCVCATTIKERTK